MGLTRGQKALNRLYDENKTNMVLQSCEISFKDGTTENKEGDIEIAGWFITEGLIESRQMIIKTSAFDHSKAFTKFNGRVLAFHDDMKEPIGEVTNLELVKNKGLRGTVNIYRENSDLFKRAINEGVLSAFSIGFHIEEWSFNEKTEILTVDKALLNELSVVHIGADANAVFEVLCSLKNKVEKTTEHIKHIILQGGNILPKDENKDAKLDQFMTDQEKLGTKVEELQEIFEGVKETQVQFTNNMITKADLAEKMETFSTELDTIKTQIEEVKAAKSLSENRLAYKDYRSMITDFVWLTDDDGNKLGEIAQRAYCLFQMPVDYDNMDNGQALKNLRDLHDAVILADSMSRYRNRDRYSIQNLKIYKQLVKATAQFDKDISLAMAGGNTGYGAEWIPLELSSEFNEILRVSPKLSSKIITWNMPKGGSAKYPFQNGKAVVYKGAEALVDNAEEARKTNVATGVKTFTPDVFIGALISSEEITEDAILDMVQFIRNELATALLEGLESALINGDDSTTHFDNAGGDGVYAAYNVETSFKGIRKLGIGNARDIELSSSTTGVNALELVNFTDAKGDLGVAGLEPAKCIYVTGIKGRTITQQALFKEDALGVLAFMISGTLPNIDGSEVYISGEYDEALDSNGLRNSGNDVKHTSMCCLHKPSFRIGQRRGVTLEFNKNILTQQQQFVATARWDFGKISADSIAPVSEMINMQHTT